MGSNAFYLSLASLDSHTRDWVNALRENSPRTAEQLAVYVIAVIDL